MVVISMTSPSSRGLGQQPLTLRTGVQIPLGTPPSPPQHIVLLCSHLPITFLILNGFGQLTVSNAPERIGSGLWIRVP